MTSQPLVSIVMPALDSSRYVAESIGSVRAQTFTDWELIVVDDCSSDRTPAIVREIAAGDPRVRLIEPRRHLGPGPARNVGIAQARGRYLCFLDSQDLWTPGKLERQLRFMRERSVAFSYSDFSMIDAEGRPLGRVVRPPRQLDYRGLLKNTIVAPQTVMLDRERVGPVEMPDLPQHEDLVTFYAILKRGIVAEGMGEDLMRYRILGGSASRNKMRSAVRMWRVYRRVEGLGRLDAAWCFAHYAWNAVRKYWG